MKPLKALLGMTVVFVMGVFLTALYPLAMVKHVNRSPVGMRLYKGVAQQDDPLQVLSKAQDKTVEVLTQSSAQQIFIVCCVLALLFQWLHTIATEFIDVLHTDMDALRRHTESLSTSEAVEIHYGECELATYTLMLGEQRIVSGIYLIKKTCPKNWVTQMVHKDLMSRTSAWFQFRCQIYERFNRAPVVSRISAIEDFALDGIETDLAITEKGMRRGVVITSSSPPKQEPPKVNAPANRPARVTRTR